MFKKTRIASFALMTLAAFCPTDGRAGCQYSASQLAQLKQQAAEFAKVAPTYCGNSRPEYQAVCRQIKAAIAQVDQAVKDCASQSTQPAPSTPTNQCDQVRKLIETQAANSKQNALNVVNRTAPGRNGGYQIYYYYPPTYCSNPTYTQAARPYFAAKADVTRVISQMANNGYYIANIVAY